MSPKDKHEHKEPIHETRTTQKQRKHNPKTRKKHDLPIRLYEPVAWSRWKGSKAHLGTRTWCDAVPPEALRSSMTIFQAAPVFRDRDTCVMCFREYLHNDEQKKAAVNPAKAPRLAIEDRPGQQNIIATELGESVARKVDAVVNEETPR